jgi:RNA polymerase sigma-70 factor (ECF subfamily)
VLVSEVSEDSNLSYAITIRQPVQFCIDVHSPLYKTVTFSRLASYYYKKPALRGLVNLSQASESEERLLIEAAQKDPSRFAELYEQNFHRVYAYIARRVRDRAETQDLTAHVFHQALANIGKFKWKGSPFAAWLYRIAANAIADQAKRKMRESSEQATAPSQSSSAVDPEEIERRARLFGAVDKLPEDQRLVIVMRFADEKSIREIADALGRSEGAVKQLQFRGLENLRNRLNEK